jgi:hypothetical protein
VDINDSVIAASGSESMQFWSNSDTSKPLNTFPYQATHFKFIQGTDFLISKPTGKVINYVTGHCIETQTCCAVAAANKQFCVGDEQGNVFMY